MLWYLSKYISYNLFSKYKTPFKKFVWAMINFIKYKIFIWFLFLFLTHHQTEAIAILGTLSLSLANCPKNAYLAAKHSCCSKCSYYDLVTLKILFQSLVVQTKYNTHLSAHNVDTIFLMHLFFLIPSD